MSIELHQAMASLQEKCREVEEKDRQIMELVQQLVAAVEGTHMTSEEFVLWDTKHRMFGS